MLELVFGVFLLAFIMFIAGGIILGTITVLDEFTNLRDWAKVVIGCVLAVLFFIVSYHLGSL